MAFQTIFEYGCRTQLIHGPGSISRLPECFTDKDRVLVVTDRGLVEAGVVEPVVAVLDNAGIPHSVYDGVAGNPPAASVNGGHRQYAKDKCTAIIGLGGGSPMDVAKMVGVLATHGGRINQYLGLGKVTKDLPPLVFVPTTYGTGSEVTRFAVLTNPKTKNKDAVVSPKIVPGVGILDPDLCVALPASVGGPTAVDALTHALESYINLKSCPITEGIALAAIELIGDNARLACANDHETEATGNMLIASAMAGMAFSGTLLGNVHAMSHPVGAQFDVHHGVANAILLPYVMEFNLQARPGKFAAIAQALGGDTDELTEYEAAWMAVQQVRELNDDLGIPEQLGEVGVKESAIPAMSRLAFQSPNVQVNPRKTSLEDIEDIFRQAT